MVLLGDRTRGNGLHQLSLPVGEAIFLKRLLGLFESQPRHNSSQVEKGKSACNFLMC